MRKKLFIAMINCIVMLSLIGCDTSRSTISVSNNKDMVHDTFFNFKNIGSTCFVYDPTTRIVYMDFTYIPYYASNGLPYRYDPETNTFEEIVN